MKNSITVRVPATVANVNCGFDILGFSLKGIFDEIEVVRREDEQIKIFNETPYPLPKDITENVTTIGMIKMLSHLKKTMGLDVIFKKKIRPGSGIGSSAASACAGVVALDAIMETHLPKKELIDFAMWGEEKVSHSFHADNIAPAMLGGMILVSENHPLKLISLPYPKNLYCHICLPHIVIKTAESRNRLPKNIPLKDTTKQNAHIATFITGLYENDMELIKRGCKENFIENYRKNEIPQFETIKEKILDMKEVICFGISGSGPSLFTLTTSKETAEMVSQNIKKIFDKVNILQKNFISTINPKGVEIL